MDLFHLEALEFGISNKKDDHHFPDNSPPFQSQNSSVSSKEPTPPNRSLHPGERQIPNHLHREKMLQGAPSFKNRRNLILFGFLVLIFCEFYAYHFFNDSGYDRSDRRTVANSLKAQKLRPTEQQKQPISVSPPVPETAASSTDPPKIDEPTTHSIVAAQAVVREEPEPALEQPTIAQRILKSLYPEMSWSYPDIGAVCTWVNGSGPVWLVGKQKYQSEFLREMMGHKEEQPMAFVANANNRFRDHEELRYSIRSILKHAPWVRKIHVVVLDGQVPAWLNIDHPKINILPHSVIFLNKTHLLTFNSNAIESNLYNIPGLSDYFWYFNDDFFLGNNVSQNDILVSKFTGQQKRIEDHYSPRKQCHFGCPYQNIGNNQCDVACNNRDCGWDQGDCGQESVKAGLETIQKELRSGLQFKLGSGDFGVNMKYTDSLLNRDIPPPLRGERKTIQHVPHLINKKIMQDMRKRYAAKYDWTSEHRFRHAEDIQFSFAYFHYIDAVRVYAPTRRQAWRAALTSIQDSSTVFLYQKEPTSPMLRWDRLEKQRFKNITDSEPFRKLQHCATELISGIKKNAAECDDVMSFLLDDMNLRLPVVGNNVGGSGKNLFVMIGDDKQDALKQLNRVEYSSSKFITINDNMSRYIPDVEDEFRRVYLRRFPQLTEVEKQVAAKS